MVQCMKYIAYARGEYEMDLNPRIKAIMEFCSENEIVLHKEKVYSEKGHGKAAGTPVFNIVKELLDDEDVLIVFSMSDIGVDKKQLLEEMKWIEAHKIRFISLDMPLSMTGYKNQAISNTHNAIRVETLNCIFAADQRRREAYQKKHPEYTEDGQAIRGIGVAGRPRTLSKEKFNAAYERVLRGEIKPFELIEELGIPKGTYYRYKSDYDREHELD